MPEPGRSTKTPLLILTGFLGAGKTTLLQEILAAERFGRSAVLVNEFGEVGIDQNLVTAVSPDIVLLDSGCICCQIRGELKEALRDLLDRRSSGELPPFSRIILETTGLAEPAPIVSTIHADLLLQNQMYVDAIATVVDGAAGLATAPRRPEWLQQVASADTLIVSKYDVDPRSAAELEAYLATLNPEAEICVRSAGDPLPPLFRGDVGRGRPARAAGAHRAGAGGHSAHEDTVRSTIIHLAGPIDWIAFGVWLSALLHAHGRRILRVKGVLDVGEGRPVLLNGVQHMVFPPEHLDDWPADAETSRLVFILDGLDPALIHRSFAKHVPKAGDSAGAS